MLELTIVGRITKDAVIKPSPKNPNQSIIEFTVVHTFKGRNGEDYNTFINCAFFRDRTDGTDPYLTVLKKDYAAFVKGVPRTSSYTAKDGTQKSSQDCIVNYVEVMGKLPERVSTQLPTSGALQTGAYANIPPPPVPTELVEPVDDLPF